MRLPAAYFEFEFDVSIPTDKLKLLTTFTESWQTSATARFRSILSSKPAAVDPVVDKKEGDGMSHVVVMPAPSKRGRKKKTALSRVGHMGPGNETLILAHLTAGGQVRKYRCRKGNLR